MKNILKNHNLYSIICRYFGMMVLMLQSFNATTQVVINEVMVMPLTDGTSSVFQSMYNSTAGSGAEWIELYNTDPCNAADISCFSLGGMDGGTNGGVFSFPAGTTIPPRSFIVIGGPNATNVTFNLSSFMPANGSANLWGSSGSRWHLPNGDGWLILYNASGAVVDGVYWYFGAADPANKITTDPTFVATMTRPTACGGGTLSDARSNQAALERIPFTTSIGLSFSRTADGGTTWQRAAPTANACNGPCVGPCAVLSNKLSRFEGNCATAGYKQFNWTIEEPQLTSIELEKSTDAITFESLQSFTATEADNNYQVELFEPEASYFRLKMTDREGVVNYSNLISVDCDDASNHPIRIFPNPTSGELSIVLNAETEPGQLQKIEIYDALGRMLKEISTTFVDNNLTIDVSDLAAGLYWIKLANANSATGASLLQFVKK